VANGPKVESGRDEIDYRTNVYPSASKFITRRVVEWNGPRGRKQPVVTHRWKLLLWARALKLLAYKRLADEE